MLVDAAKQGDVEIPVFCYEPKLGAAGRRLPHVPGRDRGHPQAADRLLDAGQGRHGRPHPDRRACTQAQEAVVEFLLINHPLDCPVCDKGGECPLQDISFGWGGGRSRFIEPKRHFQKPLALSPLIAIDRERCILCYRCVRFSRRSPRTTSWSCRSAAPHTYVGDLRRPPLRRAVQRQHHRAVPGGRADLAALPLPRAPVGHRGRRARSARCARRSATSPSPCATSASLRVLGARQRTRSTTAGCATRAASPTSPSTSTSASPRRWSATAASCARSPGSARSTRPPAALAPRQGPRRRARRRRDDQRGGLPAAAPAARGRSARPTSTRAPAARSPLASCTARCRAPGAAGDGAPTSSSPTPCWCSTASRSTTCRSSTCASARACAATASSWPSPAQPAVVAGPQRGAPACASRPAAARPSLLALSAAAAGRPARRGRPPAEAAGADSTRARARSRAAGRRRRRDPLRRAPVSGPRAAQAARALLALADALGLARPRRRRACSCVPDARQRPRAARGGRAAQRRPGLRRGRSRRPRRRARSPPPARAGELTALYLLHADPVARPARARRLGARAGARHHRHRPRRLPHRRHPRARQRRLPGREPTPRRTARSRTPTGACSACAPAIGHPGQVPLGLVGARRARAAASASTSACSRGPMATRPARRRRAVLRRADARRDRRPRRALAGARGGRAPSRPPSPPSAGADAAPRRRPSAPAQRALRLGTFRSIWAAPEVRALARAAVPHAAASASRWRPTTPSASALPTATTWSSAHDGQRGRRDRRAASRGARRHGLPAGRRLPATTRQRARPGPLVEVRKRDDRPSPVRRGRLLRAVVDADPQGARDLRSSACNSCRSCWSSSASCSGRFQGRYGPNRVGPFGVAAADGRHRQARWPRSSSARAPRSACLFALAPMISIMTAVAAVRAHPVRRRRRHLRHARPASTASTSRSARSYLFALRRDRLLRDHARRLGLGLEVLVPGRDARRRAADLLRGRAGPGARRRGHDRADAVADRDRPRARRACGTSSRSSSAS